MIFNNFNNKFEMFLQCAESKWAAYIKWSKRNKFLNIFFIFYMIISTILYLHYNVMVFDEIWFVSCFSNKGFTNHLAYGYLYWFFIKLVHYKFFLRLIALFCMLSIPIIIYKIDLKAGLNEARYNSVVFLWLTFPAAWWYGKLVAPELYCLALGFWGFYLAFPPEKSTKRKIVGVVMMGASVGIKMSFIIFPVFY